MTCKKIYPPCNQQKEFPFSWDGTPTYLFRAPLNNAQVHLFSSLWAGPKISSSIFSHHFFSFVTQMRMMRVLEPQDQTSVLVIRVIQEILVPVG